MRQAAASQAAAMPDAATALEAVPEPSALQPGITYTSYEGNCFSVRFNITGVWGLTYGCTCRMNCGGVIWLVGWKGMTDIQQLLAPQSQLELLVALI